MKLVFLILGLVALSSCNQYTPVPDRPLGVSYGDSKKLVIEAFLDLACPDSRDSFRILDDVLSQGFGTQFKYVIHMFSLPYHRTGYPDAQGFAFLADVSPAAAYQFAKSIFDNQEELSETATFELTWQQVLDKIAGFAQQYVYPLYPYDQAKFAQALLPGTDYNLKARYWWKYGTYRTISGAPVFLANGVILQGAEDYEAQDWIDFINKLNPKSQEL